MGARRQEKLFMGVERPARYAGGELNSARPKENVKGRMALVFPDTYEIGMSTWNATALSSRQRRERALL